MKITVSLGQMDVIVGDTDRNLETVKRMTAEASRRGSDLVIFPELWATGYDLQNVEKHASAISQGVFAETAALARQYGLHILGSNFSVVEEGRFGNTAVLFGPRGATLGTYTKVHLFAPMDEDRYLTAGNALTLVDLPWGLTGLAICYDLRFPELTRAYGVAGASLILMPSEWPYPRLAHWRTLLRARAIENQVFIAACNRTGVSGDTSFFGHSTIVDPAGDIIIEGGEGEMLLTASMDMGQVNRVRSLFNVFDDRRPETYSNL
ncbi:MAG TPA: carbon-nitrogen family hydrolase [candidate division Zixibacteria bacterium]|nr:carbon-nitrogen family hydrolase [candidate division Zixibacteria bacterium]